MPNYPTYPSVYIEDVPRGARTITGVATSITAFAGWSPKGPADHAQLVESWQDYERHFGGLDINSQLSYAVYHFFLNGGSHAYIVRLVADDTQGTGGNPLKPNDVAFEAKLNPPDKNGGIYLLDRIDLFNIMCVPGETKPSVLGELEIFCHERRAFLIADCARTDTYASMSVNGMDSAMVNAASINAALYFPWVHSLDSLRGNRLVAFPPSGFVAGLFARTDATRGVWKAPAGNDASLVGVKGLKEDLSDHENGVLNPLAINCIRHFPTYGIVVWGARTIYGDDLRGSEWKYIPVRRLALFIEESLYRGTKWVVFEPNDETLWSQIRQSVGAFMLNLFRQGAFQGNTPGEAYLVKCDSETNTQHDIDQGIVNIVVGFAPLKPAEFIILNIQQKAIKGER